jgi:hypothetical protein
VWDCLSSVVGGNVGLRTTRERKANTTVEALVCFIVFFVGEDVSLRRRATEKRESPLKLSSDISGFWSLAFLCSLYFLWFPDHPHYPDSFFFLLKTDHWSNEKLRVGGKGEKKSKEIQAREPWLLFSLLFFASRFVCAVG